MPATAAPCPRVFSKRLGAHIFLLLLAVFLPPSLSATDQQPLRVAVASNFVTTLEQLQPDFEARHDYRLALSGGATGKHYAQLRQGAPFDVFLAADATRPALLDRAGLSVPGTRATYATGRIALWAPGWPAQTAANVSAGASNSAAAVLRAALIENPRLRLAIANPRLAPYGVAADHWLNATLGPEHPGPQRVRGENVAQAHHFVATGSVAMGIVALSQLRGAAGDTAAPGNRVTAMDYWLIDEADHPPIQQQLVLMRDSPGARAFHSWLLSAEVQGQLGKLGYGKQDAER